MRQWGRIVGVLGMLALLSVPAMAKEPDRGWYPNARVGYWNLDMGYRMDFGSAVSTGAHSIYFETGLNAARFFHAQTLLGPFVGLATGGGNAYASGFQEDVRSHYRLPDEYSALLHKDIITDPYTEEELRALEAYQTGESRMGVLMDGSPEGEVGLYYGIMFRYPHKYAPVVKLYSMWYNTNMGSVSTGLYEVGSGYISTARTLDRFGWGVEAVLFQGYTVISEEGLGKIDLAYVSLFYEVYDFRNARIYMKEDEQDVRDIRLNEFVTQDFWDTYGTETRLGLRIGFHLL